ncbi:MAG: MerR family transcriptional regulator [Candidatus Cryptobacteroides sp.]
MDTNNAEKLYYTIGEVSSLLGESTSLVRFWTNSFSRFLKPKRNAKGNRLYTSEDIAVLKQIHLLVKVQGMTLDGAAKKMSADKKAVDGKVKVLESLKNIRKQLVEVRKSL